MSENSVKQSQGLHVVHSGRPEAAPLLLIHGSGASGACWAPMVPALAERHHVVTIDLPGLGHSAPVTSYDIPAQAARVAAMIDALELGPLTVVGHSSGGYVATSLAEQRPELVKSMVLLSTGPRLEALRPQRAIIRALSGPPLGRLIWALRSDKLIRKGISAVCAVEVDIPDELVADLRGLPYRDFVDVLRCNGEYITERGVPERLAKLDVPLLVVFGAADPRWDPASAKEYAVVPGARIEMLPGIGHVTPLEAPERAARLVLEFTA
ncbi:alpha/beta fold hydrolase [Kribbella sp. NPDC058693]|uniref:alpha/beta fold hydrolase n=1 Tax=Kribbella sp. NPDC058693 TaxID=3346602 RepID=UPI003658083A